MKKIFMLGYSWICYGVGIVVVAYYADFLVGLYIPKTVHAPSVSPPLRSAVINSALLLLFCLQHSLMARPSVKLFMRRYVPFAMERSTYILFSSWALIALCVYWQPIPATIFDARGTWLEPVLWGFYALGWATTMLSTFMIDHFDLFGLKQAWYYGRKGKTFTYKLVMPLLYKVVRHPIYLGWLMVHWFTPYFTVGQLLMAVVMTVYIAIAMRYEETDLVKAFGPAYVRYQQDTPALLPFVRLNKVSRKESN